MAHKNNTVGYHRLLSDWNYVLELMVPAYLIVVAQLHNQLSTYIIMNIHIINYVTMQKVNRLFMIGS